MKMLNDVLVVGVALFAMFFGAGNLIFPPYMGMLAGTDWKKALVGFLVTGIGMPLLGIMASARAGGSVEHLAGRVSPVFGRVLSIVVILAIGPLLAIPRTCATTFELGVQPIAPNFSPALFSEIYFGLTLFFAPFTAAFFLLPPSTSLFYVCWFFSTASTTAYFGPVFAAIQELAPVHVRSSTVAFGLLVTNLLGVGPGPWITGLIGDRSSLTIGLLVSLGVSLAAVIPFSMAARAAARPRRP